MLFTNGFPYGTGEQFIETEILYLSKAFNKVIIFPKNVGGARRSLPSNVETLERLSTKSWFTVFINLKISFAFFRVIYLEFIGKRKTGIYKGKLKYFSKSLAANFKLMLGLRELVVNNKKPVVLYTYWFNEWANALGLLNSYNPSKFQYVTRIHGYDYDINRRPHKYIPFRSYQMNHVSKIYSVSNFGKMQVNQTYPNNQITEHHRLGVSDFGNNPWDSSKMKTIVSCSNLVSLKRVDLIIEMLSHLEFEVKWIHFGDGELKNKLIAKASELPKNIEVEFAGQVDNKTILEFYRCNSIDIFINTSKFEGVPVSLMEAISFGIPIVGCEVGGVPEIVNDETGILLEESFDVKEAATLISTFLCDNAAKNIEKRNKVKRFWKQYYCAEVNYEIFIEDIKKYKCNLV